MIVAFLITLFVLWLLLAPRGRMRLAETTRSRPGYALWLGLGAVLVLATYWGMLVPDLRVLGMETPFGRSELWRVTGVLFLIWVGASGAVMLARGRL